MRVLWGGGGHQREAQCRGTGVLVVFMVSLCLS